IEIEIEHNVDRVFKEFRASGFLLLRDLTDKKENEILLLSKAAKNVCALPDLGGAPGECIGEVGVHRLNGIDDDDLWGGIVDMGSDFVHVHFEEQENVR